MKENNIIPIIHSLCRDEAQQEDVYSHEHLKTYVDLANRIVDRLASENFDQSSISGVP